MRGSHQNPACAALTRMMGLFVRVCSWELPIEKGAVSEEEEEGDLQILRSGGAEGQRSRDRDSQGPHGDVTLDTCMLSRGQARRDSDARHHVAESPPIEEVPGTQVQSSGYSY